MELTTRSQQALNDAVTAAAQRGNPAVEPAHLLVALLDDSETLVRPVLQAVGADPGVLRAEAQAMVDRLPSAAGSSVGAPQQSRGWLAVFGDAQNEARERGDSHVSVEHLLLATAGHGGEAG